MKIIGGYACSEEEWDYGIIFSSVTWMEVYISPHSSLPKFGSAVMTKQ